MSKQYQNYSVKDFDKFDCLKLSKVYFFAILFIVRAYVVWIMSVTNFNDSVATIQWLYPETTVFYLHLLSGALGLFLIIFISLRRPNSPTWVKSLWPYSRLLLAVTLLFDLLINLIGYFYWQLTSITWLMGQATIVLLLISLSYRNKRIKINLIEFPKPLPEK